MISLKQRLRTTTRSYGGIVCVTPSPVTTQAIAAAGADFVMIDQEHGAIGPESLHAMIASTQGTACAPLVRVSRHDAGLVKTALDAGAEGIVFPMINSAQEAADCVAMTRYPPRGRRGWGPYLAHSRWNVPLADYAAARGDETLCVLLIETAAAVEHIDEICTVDGIDVLAIATADLAMDLGVAGSSDAPALLQAVAHAERAILAAGIVLGGAAMNPQQARTAQARGYRLLFMGVDVLMLKDATAATATSLLSAPRE